LYIRQSKLDDLGVDRQIELTTALATARQWTVVGIFRDNDTTASRPRGPSTGWGRMLATANDGDLDVVIAVDLDRLLRSTRDLNTLVDAGLAAVTVDGEIDLTTADGEFRATMLAAVARFEVRRKGERQARALRQRAEIGLAPKGVRLAGYDVHGNVVADEAAVVREVFERFLAGDSLRALATDLDARGVPTRSGGTWNPSTVRGILQNARYAGWSTYKGEIVEKDGQRVRGAWPTLVSEATYDAVRQRLQDPVRRSNRVGTHRKHLGSGLYRCGVCDHRVRVHSGLRYRCPAGHVLRSIGQIDGFVKQIVRARLQQPDIREVLVDRSRGGESELLTREIDDLRRRLSVVETDYDDGVIDGRRYAEASRKLHERLNAAEENRAALSTGKAVASVLNASSPDLAFEAATLGVQRSTVEVLMDVVLFPGTRGRRELDPQTVEIRWRADPPSREQPTGAESG